jgi:signal transduction histidine kinase
MPAQTRELIEMAHRRTGELAGVTQQLLALARARGSKATVEHVPVDLTGVAQRVLDKFRLRAEQARVTLTFDADPDIGEIRGDAEALGDLMGNLVENAIRYNAIGGTVRCSLRALPGAVALDVEDTGIGIPEEDLPRIFEDFFRSKAARDFTHEGSGLGMAIVKAVVDQHGGTISVDSTPGRGTRVHVILPRSGAP